MNSTGNWQAIHDLDHQLDATCPFCAQTIADITLGARLQDENDPLLAEAIHVMSEPAIDIEKVVNIDTGLTFRGVNESRARTVRAALLKAMKEAG